MEDERRGRKQWLHVRLTDSERSRLAHKAQAAGKSASELAREGIELILAAGDLHGGSGTIGYEQPAMMTAR